MLVSGLKDASLSRIISDAGTNYAHVHESLCQCAREMLAKYEKKQECSTRKIAKTLALKTMLSALGSVSENPRTAVSFGLQCHALILQGCEHLLSEKGNTYELMRQTQGLSKAHNTTASLLRYHDLKAKLLGPDTTLSAEQKKVISALAEEKSLTLKTLEILETFSDTTVEELMKLNQTILRTPDLCAGAFNHEYSIFVAKKLTKLYESGCLEREVFHKPPEQLTHGGAVIALQILKEASMARPDWCVDVLKHKNPYMAAQGLVKLNQHGLDTTPYSYYTVIKHREPLTAALAFSHMKYRKLSFTDEDLDTIMAQENPLMAVMVMEEADRAGLLEEHLRAEVFKYKKPFQAIEAMSILNEADLLNQGLLAGVLKHESSEKAAKAFVELYQNKMYTPDNYSAVFKQENPYAAALVIIHLDSHQLFTHETSCQVLEHENLYRAAEAFLELNKHDLDTTDNHSLILKHGNPLSAALAIIHLNSHQLFTDENLALVMTQGNPLLAAMVLEKLNKAGLLEASLRAEASRQENPYQAVKVMDIVKGVDLLNKKGMLAGDEHEQSYMSAEDFVILNQQKICLLDTSYSVIFTHKNPYLAALAITHLDYHHLCTEEIQHQVFKHENPFEAAKALVEEIES